MRSRILLIVALVLFPLAALASPTAGRDMLLTPDGTLYTIESAAPDALPDLNAAAARILTLTIQNGSKSTTTVVPASTDAGYNFTPALAFDADSKTLFIFWERMRDGGFTSDLVFCSFSGGKWGAPATLDSVTWDLRQNLRIAITRTTESKNDKGETISIPEVTVHAAWWEISGSSEWARYAMLTINNGNVISTQVQDLADFTTTKNSPVIGTDEQELLRHPAIFESADHSTVDVVFGDIGKDVLHRVTLRPVATPDGRLRIPIGRSDHRFPAAHANLDPSSDVAAISTNADNLAFYASTKDEVRYFVLKSGNKWQSQSVALNEKVSRDAAIDALERMLASQ